MNQRGIILLVLLVIVGIILIVGAGAYFISTRQIVPPAPTPAPTSTTPTPIPFPAPTPSSTPTSTLGDTNFDASPKLGAPPLGVYFNENPKSPTAFSGYLIDYGDGSHDSLQQQCATGLGTINGCAVTARHTYKSSGTFVAILYGVNTDGTSKTLGTVTITVGNPLNVTKTVGETESSFLIQKINQDSVDGLWYQEYPVATTQGAPKTLHIGDDIGYACEGVSEKLTSIDFTRQSVTFTISWGKKPIGGCPICLAGDTLISTPAGSVPVKDLQVGMPVWTINKAGQRVFGVVTETSKVLVPPTHQMVHLVLSDGRELLASPGHPTADGRTIGDLAPGDWYNGALVTSSERVPYGENATYDLLPSGETGFYWANGVLLGSTLSPK